MKQNRVLKILFTIELFLMITILYTSVNGMTDENHSWNNNVIDYYNDPVNETGPHYKLEYHDHKHYKFSLNELWQKDKTSGFFCSEAGKTMSNSPGSVIWLLAGNIQFSEEEAAYFERYGKKEGNPWSGYAQMYFWRDDGSKWNDNRAGKCGFNDKDDAETKYNEAMNDVRTELNSRDARKNLKAKCNKQETMPGKSFYIYLSYKIPNARNEDGYIRK